MNITIVGAGFSGLTLAHFLKDEGFNVEVLEASSKPGGLISTKKTDYGLVETAATSILLTPALEQILKQINLRPLLANKESKKRFIVKNQRPSRLPLSILGCLGLFRGLFRLVFFKSKWQTKPEESLATWADRVFGNEVRKALISPAMQGIYASPAEDLSASLVLKKIFAKEKRVKSKGAINFDNGMGGFIQSLESSLVERGVTFKYNQKLTKDKLPKGPTVLATSMKAAKDLLQEIPELPLKNMTSATVFFEGESPIQGFGVLFPKEEGLNAHGVLLNDCMFKNRTKSGHSETWILSEVHQLSKDQIQELIYKDRKKLFKNEDNPVSLEITTWEDAFPIYSTHLEKCLSSSIQTPKNLYLTGNYLGNLGLSGILEQNIELSKKLKKDLM